MGHVKFERTLRSLETPETTITQMDEWELCDFFEYIENAAASHLGKILDINGHKWVVTVVALLSMDGTNTVFFKKSIDESIF